MFEKYSVGLDIADRSLEAVELVKSSGQIKISKLARLELEPGIVERGRIKNGEKLAAAVRNLFSVAQPEKIEAKEVIFGLPDSQAYPHIFNCDGVGLKREDLERQILREAQTNIPLEAEDLFFCYKILATDQTAGLTKILLIATSKATMLEWKNFFDKIKLRVNFFDVEALAVFRSIYSDADPKGPVCLLDIGSNSTIISIFDNRRLCYSSTFNIAGESLTNELAANLKASFVEAETIKRKADLSSNKQKAVAVLSKKIDLIANETAEILRYYQGAAKKIEEIVLVGGSSQLKGLEEYLAKKLNLPICLGQSKLLENKSFLFYAEAVGLALKGLLDRKEFEQDPVFDLSELKASNKFKQKNEAVEPPKTREEAVFIDQETEEKATSTDVLPLVNENNGRKKIRLQVIALAVILLIGVVAIGLAYWYRTNQETNKKIKTFGQKMSQLTIDSFLI